MVASGKRQVKAKWLWYAIDVVPVLLPVAITAFGAVAMVLLLIGQLRSSYAWSFGLLAVVVATGIVVRYYRDAVYEKERRICNLLVGLGVILWGAYNVIFSAQHLITNRDPGTYTNTGIWLIHHVSLRIPAVNIFGSTPSLAPDSPGFAPYTYHGSEYLYAQGLHLLPVLLGLAGRIVGVKGMLHANILFGMTALLAIYALGRLLVRPLWAMIATGVLAASMPFLYFSRDTYTEPLAATFTFGALALLFLALKTKKPSLWLLVGLITGAGTLTRIDGFLTIAAMTLFAVIMVALAKGQERASAVRNSVLLLIGMACTGLLGWLDLWLLSRSYYGSLKSEFFGELGLIVAFLAGGAILIALCWHTKLLKQIDARTKDWRAIAIVAAIIGYTIFLASRPLWTFGKLEAKSTATEWVVWYAGPIFAFLGLIGMALVGAQVITKKKLLLLAMFIVVLITAGLYITFPNISPDQIWASRRLVPVIMPGLAIFAAIAIDWIDRNYAQDLRLRWRYLFMVFVAVSALIGPLLTSRPDLIDHDTDLLAQVQNICDALPAQSAILWTGYASEQLIEPTRNVCNVPAEGYDVQMVPSDLAKNQFWKSVGAAARNKGYTPIVGVYGYELSGLPTADQQNMTYVSTFSYEELVNPVGVQPTGTQVIDYKGIYLGVIEPNGSIGRLP